jgi:hypothetical protein
VVAEVDDEDPEEDDVDEAEDVESDDDDVDVDDAPPLDVAPASPPPEQPRIAARDTRAGAPARRNERRATMEGVSRAR